MASARTSERSSLASLGGLVIVGALVFLLGHLSMQLGAAGAAACALAAFALVTAGAVRLERKYAHPLRTAAGVLDALRHGDYAHRARTDVVAPPIAPLLVEINQLAEHLQATRLRAEETAALLEALIERVDVALLAFDDADQLVWWNPAALELFGGRLRPGKHARELGAHEFFSGPSQRSVTLPGQAAPGAWELRRGVFRRAGKRYHFILLSSLQRVRREEERAAWQRLVRVLGHEVNNTLAPIQSLSATCRGLLQDGAGGALPRVLEALELIERRSASLSHFISEFARLARLPEPKLEPLELGACVRRVLAFDSRCAHHVLGKGSLEVLADDALLTQALVNLSRNAVDASLTRGGAITVDWHSEGDLAVLSIIDEGPGITNPDNLFVPLFSTKPGGSGIGLVLARNIIEAHGGELRLDNRAQQSGCIARVTLPLATDQRSGRADPGGAPGGQPGAEQPHQ